MGKRGLTASIALGGVPSRTIATMALERPHSSRQPTHSLGEPR